MKNAATINDVAKIAGVSKSTVSRYLNGKPLKETTSIKIKEAIEKTNYQANMFARLSAKKSYIIGIVVPGFDSTVNPRILTYVDKYLRNKNYTPLIINTEDDMDFEARSIENLASMKVDGIIVVASYITNKHKEVIKNISTPVIFLGQEFKEGISIVDDNYRAGYEFGKYVGKSGIKSVACLWVDEKDIQVGKNRKKGVIDGLKDEGVNNISEKITDFSFNTSYKKAMEILKEEKKVEAIMCATDRIAHGVYKACIELGLKIPEDVSVTGFGGYDSSEILTPPLTTIKFDVETASFVCVDTILKMTEDKPVSKKQVTGFKFIEGKSVK